MIELKGKYNMDQVNPSVVDEASNELDSAKTDKQNYEDFKSKLVMLSEPDLNAYEVLLDKERTTYEALLKKLEQPGCKLNEVKATLNSLC